MSSPLSSLPYLVPDDTDVHGFSGYTVLAIMAWITIILSLIAFFPLSFCHHCHQPSPQPNIDIELDNHFSHVNPESAREQLYLQSMSTIKLPPAAYLRPSDTFPDLTNPQPSLLKIDQPHPVKVYGVRPVVLNNISMSDLRGSDCHGHAS